MLQGDRRTRTEVPARWLEPQWVTRVISGGNALQESEERAAKMQSGAWLKEREKRVVDMLEKVYSWR